MTTDIVVEVTEDIARFLRAYALRFGEAKLDHCVEVSLDRLLAQIRAYRAAVNDATWTEANILRDAKIIRRERHETDAASHMSELEMMRLRAGERAYQRSVRGLTPVGAYQVEDTFSAPLKSLGMGINLIVGLFLTFLVGYFLAFYSGLRHTTAMLLCGVLFSLGYLVVEVALLVLYDYKLDKKKTKANQQRDALSEIKEPPSIASVGTTVTTLLPTPTSNAQKQQQQRFSDGATATAMLHTTTTSSLRLRRPSLRSEPNSSPSSSSSSL